MLSRCSIDTQAFEHGEPLGFNTLAKEHPILQRLPAEVAYNVRVPCGEFPALDLRKWRQEPYTGPY